VLHAVLVLMHDMQSSNLEEPVSNRYSIVYCHILLKYM